MKQTKKMDNNYKEWLDAVTKNVASVLECSVKDAAILVEETNQAESLYDINTLVALASHEIVLEIRKAKSKIQLRGTFTLNQYIESQKVSAFCVDLELSEWEKDKLFSFGREKYHDIQASKIIEDHIVSLNSGYPEGGILILSLEFWGNEGAGWYIIPFKK